MTTEKPAGKQKQPLFIKKENNEQFSLLHKYLTGRPFGFVLCRVTPLERSIIHNYYQQHSLKKRIHSIDLTTVNCNTALLQDAIEDAWTRFQGKKDIFLIYNFEECVDKTDPQKKDFLERLNFIRDYFSNFKATFVFFMSDWVLKLLIREAFDFYDWFGGMKFYFVPENKYELNDPEKLQEPLEKTYTNPLKKIAYLEKSLEGVKNNSDRYRRLYDLGVLYMQVKDYKKAATVFQQAMAIDPADVRLITGYANGCVQWGDQDNARRLFEQALKIDSHDIKTLTSYANACVQWGDQDNARRLFEQALKIAPNNVQVLNSYANGCVHWGDPANARRLFELALKIEPNNVQVLNSYANGCVQWGDPDNARRLFELALKIEPNNVQVLNSYANACVMWGNLSKGRSLIERSLAIDTHHITTMGT